MSGICKFCRLPMDDHTALKGLKGWACPKEGLLDKPNRDRLDCPACLKPLAKHSKEGACPQNA